MAALTITPALASVIAKQACLNRITTYEALKRLTAKGLIKTRGKSGKRGRYFETEDVEVIKSKLEERKQQYETLLQKVDAIIPDMRSLYAGNEKAPEVYFYEGRDGIKNVLLDTLKQKPKESIAFASADFLQKGYEKSFLETYWKKRVEMKIPARGIAPDTIKARELFSPERNIKELRKVKFVPVPYYNFSDEIEIYGDNVGIISLHKGNEHGIIIRSQSIADSFRALFNLLWNCRIE